MYFMKHETTNLIMSCSQIVVPSSKAKSCLTEQQQKFCQAYLDERQNIALHEIELNRASIVMLDQYGRLIGLACILEH
ncbi:hypothetical protein CAG54_14315 [Vibrio sp. V27_P1S3P104]|uniref:hypothetical protein n=1 Tax=unclassified Vibrio TaxID=2614977 RepID=UPI001372ECB6|nr:MULTISPECIES: hypothetical protein [unclassified Vibrio]NAW69090.1 hypothetical protein [Vibrio sp. V28_P6S34P95]NAX06331.1 hypothetical protein [Vibrio sp. V30_P3S12P165]NAX33478.1 hypothetical protein [Vibrio sp. V29_P1S30P107]NAX38678.1 hypothetical protein [Vibrio sp. V27_P1S3P104]NAX39399.1 hypothetical protein [Vibrio sp. V26_P1S5P106]